MSRATTRGVGQETLVFPEPRGQKARRQRAEASGPPPSVATLPVIDPPAPLGELPPKWIRREGDYLTCHEIAVPDHDALERFEQRLYSIRAFQPGGLSAGCDDDKGLFQMAGHLWRQTGGEYGPYGRYQAANLYRVLLASSAHAREVCRLYPLVDRWWEYPGDGHHGMRLGRVKQTQAATMLIEARYVVVGPKIRLIWRAPGGTETDG